MRDYICKYCYKEFEPTRRRVQKYCSNTCRSKAYHERQTHNTKDLTQIANIPVTNNLPDKTKTESISLAGIGNATAGSLLAGGIKTLLTVEDNKTATKGDLKKLTEQLVGRYHIVNNIPTRYDGARPYFDIETGEIVYYFI